MRDTLERSINADSAPKISSENPGHRLLVAIAPNSSSEYLVRWTHRMAAGLNCPWLAVYVQTSSNLSQTDQLLLTQSLSLARELGAEVVTTNDDSVVHGLMRAVSGRNITQIIVGKPESPRYLRLFRRDAFLRRLIEESGEICVHVVQAPAGFTGKAPIVPLMQRLPAMEYVLAGAVVAAVTCFGLGLDSLLGYRSIAWIFLSAVMALAFFVRRGPILIAATLSALSWDYFFEMPRFTFYITGREDRELFFLYFAVALVLGGLTSRIRRQERAEREREERTKSLFLLTQELTKASDRDDLARRTVEHLKRDLRVEAAIFLPDPNHFMARHHASAFSLTEEEYCRAVRLFEQSRHAGVGQENVPVSKTLLIALCAYGEAEGLGAFRFNEFPNSLHQRSLIDEIAQQIAMGLHRLRMREFSENSKILAESERLSKTLLDAISHEFRTPLTAIQAAVSNLAQNGHAPVPIDQGSMVAEIQEATERLDRLMGKILHMTRLDSGFVKPRLRWLEIHDVFRVAENETRAELRCHPLTVDIPPDLPPLRMDFELMLHALVNLLSNAGRHTPDKTPVWLSARVENQEIVLSVADSGPGIPPRSLPNLFNKFYRVPNSKPGGAGLGLSIVKGFVEAQGGSVSAANRPEGGSLFTIRMRLDKDESSVVSFAPESEKCAC